MIHVIKIENVYTVNYGREAALRRCILGSQLLRNEFCRRYPPDRLINTSCFIDSMKEFAEYKKLCIVNETPIVRITDDGFYRVDVVYEIEEPISGDI